MPKKIKICGTCQKSFSGRKSSRHCSAECKFWATYDRSSNEGCWMWKGSLDGCGYGRVPGEITLALFPELGKLAQMRAHRIAFRLTMGFDPGSLYIAHSCDTPGCGNPLHLEAKSQKQNLHDGVGRGRPIIWSPQRSCAVAGRTHGKAKLTYDQIRSIRSSDEPTKVLAARYGVTRNTVARARTGQSWSHVE